MVTERLSMRKTKEILRQKWLRKLSYREVAASLGVGVGSVENTVSRAKAVGLTLAEVEQLDEAELEQRLHQPQQR